MILPHSPQVPRAPLGVSPWLKPAARVAAAVLVFALPSCQRAARQYLPVRVTGPATAGRQDQRGGWPSEASYSSSGARAPRADAPRADAHRANAPWGPPKEGEGQGTGGSEASPDSERGPGSVGDPLDPQPELSKMEWRAEAERMLDDWHFSAARGDRAAYLGHMAPDSVFMGTDASERWDFATFRAYVERHFTPGKGWTYHPYDRYLTFSSSGETVWFDEKLNSPGYGPLRGTGILRKVDSSWEIVHYSMTFLVPNDIGREVADAIREWEGDPQLAPGFPR